MAPETFHPTTSTNTYVTVILPIAAPKPYTYYVPEELVTSVQTGIRVEVQFGKNKLYAALVMDVHQNPPAEYKPKPVISVIDRSPVIFQPQIELWQWMAKYYACTLGEVMNAALPSGMKLSSETRVILSPLFDENYDGLSDKEFMITEALSIQHELSLDDIRKILNQKTVYPLISRLLEQRVIYLKEELKSGYKPKKVSCVKLAEPYHSNPELLEEAFELLSRSNRQVEALMAFIHLSKKQEIVQSQDVCKKASVDSSVLKAIEKKGVFEIYKKQVSRIGGYEEDLVESHDLSAQQITAIEAIQAEKDTLVTLLHGVTGSGKTRVYVELIQEVIGQGGQALFLLPEIALTTQIVSRLQKIFGDQIAVFHSRLTDNQRVEIWRHVLEGKPLVMGARSSLFLPFSNLKLIVVDEEHDTSYKQTDPAPRYNARDVAVFLAHQHQARIILGTATPSLESYHNALSKKYQIVKMPERFGGLELPETIIVDAKDETKKNKMQSHFTSVLLETLKNTLEQGEQVILFQNRRGYAPSINCNFCGWHAECIHCDVSLTYHKFQNNLRCHYCGYQNPVPTACPACGSGQLTLKGFGTEKIEDELKIFFPEAKISRLDYDTSRTKDAHARIINDFEEKRVDILVGTQMVTKGLDFDNVGMVGILSADQLFYFPDFRASERAFQLITQVSGRAGRKNKRGKVVIQAFNTAHPVLKEILENDYTSFYEREIYERQTFVYPPFCRLIKITLKHKKPDILNEAAKAFSKHLKSSLGDRVIGPAIPGIPRIRSFFLMDLLVKTERDMKNNAFAKACILEATHYTQSLKGFSSVRININVDPM